MLVYRPRNRPLAPPPKPVDRITFKERRVLGHAQRRREPVSLPVVRGLGEAVQGGES